MEKFGVEVEEQGKAKLAGRGVGGCPSCGSQLRGNGEVNVIACSRCGTKPFEVEVEGGRTSK